MVIASLNSENISVFAFLCNREYFSAQSKGLFLRNKCKMLRKTVKPATFVLKIKRGISDIVKGHVWNSVFLLRFFYRWLILQFLGNEFSWYLVSVEIVTLRKFSQSSNVWYSIVVTLSGIVILLRFLQLANAHIPIVFTLLGIVILSKFSQPANA